MQLAAPRSRRSPRRPARCGDHHRRSGVPRHAGHSIHRRPSSSTPVLCQRAACWRKKNGMPAAMLGRAGRALAVLHRPVAEPDSPPTISHAIPSRFSPARPGRLRADELDVNGDPAQDVGAPREVAVLYRRAARSGAGRARAARRASGPRCRACVAAFVSTWYVRRSRASRRAPGRRSPGPTGGGRGRSRCPRRRAVLRLKNGLCGGVWGWPI